MSVPATDVLVIHCESQQSAADLAKDLTVLKPGSWAGMYILPAPVFQLREMVIAEKYGNGFNRSIIPGWVLEINVAMAAEITAVKKLLFKNGIKPHNSEIKFERLYSRPDNI